MQEHWNTAIVGGLIGAAVSLIVVFAAIGLKIIPVASDARLHDYLMAHPKLAYEMVALANAQDAEETQRAEQAAVDKLGAKRFFDPAVAYVTGPANAKNTVVEFFDYNCVHCRNTAATVRKFFEAHKADTRFAFIEFPIRGDESMEAARIAVAARQQGDRYLNLHFGLMGEENVIDQKLLYENVKKAGIDFQKLATDAAKPDVEKAIFASLRLAREAQFHGTPIFIINGKVHEGEISEADLKQYLNR